MEKRYQVFVSSTFKDLEAERQEVMHALLELDCMPAGMELFPAANEDQWDLIKRVIDDCDYYVLILAGRYGSVAPDGMGYTEMEYRYALSIDKPTIAFLHRDPGKIPARKSEGTDEGREKLAAFRALVEQKLCKHWETPQDLGSVVSRSLVQLIKSTPAVGWVRANELADQEATLELLQLRRRVEELEADLARARTSAPQGAEGLAQGDELHTLNFTFGVQTDQFGFDHKTWSWSCTLSWNELFAAVAPTMIDEAPEPTIRGALNTLVMDRSLGELRSDERFRGRTLARFSIKDEDFQTVKVQLRALGLVTQSDKKRSVRDQKSYWTLTPYGDQVMTRLRAIRSGSPAADEHEPAEESGPDDE